MRFGLIGYGGIGQLRAQALLCTPGVSLVAIAEPVPTRRAEAERLGVATTSRIEELLAADVDAVVVSTPPNLHRQHCEAALSAGKHVLCEKPLAPTVDDCRAIVDAADRRGLTLGTGFNYRFYPAVSKARELVDSGRIGEVDHVESFAGHPGGPEFTHQWVHDPRIVGGGALMDNGIHLADLTRYFLGDVAASCGIASSHVWGFPGSEDNGYVLMRSAEGRAGILHATWTEWRGYHWSVEICGTRGSVKLSYPPMLTVLHERPEGAAKRGRREIYAFPVFQVQERLRSYRWTVVESFVAEQRDFVARIAGRRGFGASGLDGLRAVELVAVAYSRDSLSGGQAEEARISENASAESLAARQSAP